MSTCGVGMGLFKKHPIEVQTVLSLLDETEQQLERAIPPTAGLPSRYSEAFALVKREVLANLDKWKALIDKEKDRPEVCPYVMLMWVAGNHLQSGEHHTYRGLLSPLGLGNDLLRIFDASVDELFKLGALEADAMQGMKETIRARIKGAG